MFESTLSGRLWPVHIKPHEDELLSSWLVRLSMAHGTKLHTFCSIAWPRKAIWNRDIDKSCDSEIMHSLSKRTGTQLVRVRETTLAAYEGVIYQKHNRFGPTAWIMPIGIYHRTRKQFGLQYCPRCLADKIPFYRRKWRLAFLVICEQHQTLLRDRCPQCSSPVNFHRNELGDFHKPVAVSITLCHLCGFDFREFGECSQPVIASPNSHRNSPLSVSPDEIVFTKHLSQAINIGYVKIGETTITHTLLFFNGLRQVLKVLAMRNKRIEQLRQALSTAYKVEAYVPPPSLIHPDVQELSIKSRRQLLGLARCLLAEWPHRFIELSQRYRVWSSLWLRNLEPSIRDPARTTPFWLWQVVNNHLYRARYCPSDKEIDSAISHLKHRGEIVNTSKLSRLIGIATIRNKKLSKAADHY